MIRPTARIFLAIEPVDGRRGFDTLAERVRMHLGGDPRSGDLFVFRNRDGSRLKVLFYDRSGYVLYYKRLDRGVFAWPGCQEHSICISAQQMLRLLEGVPITQA